MLSKAVLVIILAVLNRTEALTEPSPQTPPDPARQWVQWLNNDVATLQGLAGIDTAKAVRGIIVGELGGDLVGPLMGIRQIIEYAPVLKEDDYEKLRSNYTRVYDACKMVLNSHAALLPKRCVRQLKEMLVRQGAFRQELSLHGVFDSGKILRFSLGFYDDVKDISLHPTDYGLQEDDIDYALALMNPIRKARREEAERQAETG